MWPFDSITQHPIVWSTVAGYVVTALINALPKPGMNIPIKTWLYQWLFDTLRALSNRVPQPLVPPVGPLPAPTPAVPATPAP